MPAGEASEVVVLLGSPPLARAPGNGAEIAAEQAAFRRELHADVPAAKIGWRYRLVANGFSLTLPEADLPRLRSLPGVRRILPAAASYVPQAESDRGADRRTRAVGPDARHGRPGDEDRDHRLRGRSGSPVLRPDRLPHAAGVPERAAALHDGEGHRRSRLRAEGSRLAERTPRVQPGRLESRHARRGHRGRKRRHPGGRPSHLRGRAARVHRQLQGLRRDRARASARTRTPRRSSPRSRRPSGTAWT